MVTHQGSPGRTPASEADGATVPPAAARGEPPPMANEAEPTATKKTPPTNAPEGTPVPEADGALVPPAAAGGEPPPMATPVSGGGYREDLRGTKNKSALENDTATDIKAHVPCS